MDRSVAQKPIAEHSFPDRAISTPCFVILEDAVKRNLGRTISACGSATRLLPHVKTHRAEWIVGLSLQEGIKAFKCATPAEVEMVLDAGSPQVIWAYPSVNQANIRRILAAAKKHENARVTGIVDSIDGLTAWQACLSDDVANVDLRVDLDPGMGRTGVLMTNDAQDLACAVYDAGLFAGWHVYDGHIKGKQEDRRRQVDKIANDVSRLIDALLSKNIESDVVAGGSYTFNLWPSDIARYVSPGSWTYSSAQHNEDLVELGWEQAAFVMTTVTSVRGDTATLDAGSKAISPDKALAQRFYWDRRIVLMSEEHTIVEAKGMSIGDRLLLTPGHACTTAYLYDTGMVKTTAGSWEIRGQLGCAR